MAEIEEFGNPLNPLQNDLLEASESDRSSRLRRRIRTRREGGGLVWNVLTVLIWLGMAFAIIAFVSIYTNPQAAMNPFPPARPTLVSAIVLPTITPTPTATMTTQPGPGTATSAPTETLVPTVTETPTLEPTETFTPGPSPTATIRSLYPFILRGEVKVIDGATFPDHDTCKLWVAGQAYDLQGAPMVGITVMMGGYLNDKSLYQLSLTGTALQYGPAGYEFTAADQPVKSKQAVWVELFDQAMIPLSNKIYFDTTEDCKQNLILINFRQVR